MDLQLPDRHYRWITERVALQRPYIRLTHLFSLLVPPFGTPAVAQSRVIFESHAVQDGMKANRRTRAIESRMTTPACGGLSFFFIGTLTRDCGQAVTHRHRISSFILLTGPTPGPLNTTTVSTPLNPFSVPNSTQPLSSPSSCANRWLKEHDGRGVATFNATSSSPSWIAIQRVASAPCTTRAVVAYPHAPRTSGLRSRRTSTAWTSTASRVAQRRSAPRGGDSGVLVPPHLRHHPSQCPAHRYPLDVRPS